MKRKRKNLSYLTKLAKTEEPSWTGVPNMYMKFVAWAGEEIKGM